MRYLYFPGCSLKGTGRGYEESTLAVFGALGTPLVELPDWNCCGATAYMGVDELKAFALAARNLALAEEMAADEDIHLIAPCSACYLVLAKAQHYIKEYADVAETIISALRVGGLSYNGRTRVRHPLDVLINDIGIESIESLAQKPLAGLRVACYYGCQIVRPYSTFDDQYNPTTMDRLIQALGAQTVDWPLKTRCCGGTMTGTIQDVGMRLNYILLKEAKKRGADVIATACPLCQFNLECYQRDIGKQYGNDIEIPVVYFTQLMGRAFGLGDKALGLNRLFVPFRPALAV